MKFRPFFKVILIIAIALLLFSVCLFILHSVYTVSFSGDRDERNLLIENTIRLYLDPILMAADIMAEDIFIKNWLVNENDRVSLDDYFKRHAEIISRGTIDLASVKSEIVYQFTGGQVQMSSDNERDYWYYNFMKSDKDRNAELYYDSPNGVLYVYYNVKVKDEQRNNIAVLGVSFPYYQISELLAQQSGNGVSVFLANEQGEITIHPDQTRIGSVAIYDTYGMLQEEHVPRGDSEAMVREQNIYRYISSLDELNSTLIIEHSILKERNEKFLFYFSLVGIFLILTSLVVLLAVCTTKREINRGS